MATSSTYYIDTDNFSTATAVWTDTGLTTKAPDGYYSFGGSYRQQFNGLLQPIQSCETPPPPPSELLIGGISFELETFENGCNEGVESIVYFKINDPSLSFLQIGDSVYMTDDETNPFPGVNSKYYTIIISDPLWAGSSSKYVVTISTTGVIQSILDTCPGF
jgi:hypothetical protein